MVGPSGFEPPTSPLSGVRSNQLSYGPAPLSRLHPLREEKAWPIAARASSGKQHNTPQEAAEALYLIDERT